MEVTKRDQIQEALYEHIANENFHLGISSGLDQASKRLLDKATEDFKVGKDVEAAILREESKELTKLAIQQHNKARDMEKENKNNEENTGEVV